MCPGGTVVAATSEPERVVTNGMSQYSRNERNANAGIVVGINPEQDFPGGPLAGIELQERWNPGPMSWAAATIARRASWWAISCAASPPRELGGGGAFVHAGRAAGRSVAALPDYAIDAIREALPAFGRQIRGFDRDDAVLTGVETRTSSPVRITRDPESLQSLNVRGLYPAVKARAMPAASSRRASTASKSPKRWRGACREVRRHQEAASEEIPRGVRLLPGGRRASGAGAAEGGCH